MPHFLIFCLAVVIFSFWIFTALDFIFGVLFRIPVLKPGRESSGPPSSLPKVSIIFGARDEEAHLRESVASMLAQNYPDFEVIAVDDRSTDDTLKILRSLPQAENLKIIPVRELPAGWLGKTHALYQGTRVSSGEWLLFTDADVWFHPATLRCAVQAARLRGWDHLTLIPKMFLKGWIERIFAHYFIIAFNRAFRPWAASNPRSRAYAGIGAFNLITRAAYEKIGTHKKIALQVVDDMELGRAVKTSRLRQGVAAGAALISVPWVEGFRGVMRSLEKNGFAGIGYRAAALLALTAAALVFDVLPFVLIFLAKGPVFPLFLGSLILIFLVHAVGLRDDRTFLATFPAYPVGCLLLVIVFWRSALMVWREGGVRWRDTFYPIDQLRGKS